MYQLGDKKFWQGRTDREDGAAGLRWHQIINFLDVTTTPLHKAGADLNIAFLGFCCDEGVRRNQGRIGAQGGPDALRKAMASLPVHFNREKLNLFDAGNIICPNQDMERAQQMLGKKVAELLRYGFLPIVLGGGHELAFGHYLGLHEFTKEAQTEKLGIINLDAHFDLRSFQEQASSGTPFRQIAHLRQNHSLQFNYLCLGVQEAGNTQALFQQADRQSVDYILADDIREMDNLSLQTYLEKWIEPLDEIYVTVDLDVLAAAYAPGVSASNPLGLSPHHLWRMLEYCISSGKLLSLDVAELNPQYDIDQQTAKLAAWLLEKLLRRLSELL